MTPTSFAEIYQKYAKDVFRFAMHLSGSRVDAEELTSEAFVRLWSASEVRMPTVKSYLFAITRNLFLEQRRTARTTGLLRDIVEDGSPTPEKVALDRDQARRFFEILETFPEIDRSALLMRADGLSYDEIAQALKITLANAKVKVHRTRMKIAALLKEHDK